MSCRSVRGAHTGRTVWCSLLPGIAVLGIVLNGCRPDPTDPRLELEPIKLEQMPRSRPPSQITDIGTGLPLPQVEPGPLEMPRMDVVTGARSGIAPRWNRMYEAYTPMAPGMRGSDADYIDKADVYWKLNWIRKQLQAGTIPPNLADAIARTRQQLETTQRDKNYRIAERAIQLLEEGMEHLQARRTLVAAGVASDLIPWSLGREAVQRYIDEGRLGFGSAAKRASLRPGTADAKESPAQSYWRQQRNTLTSTLTARQQSTIALILEYAEKYRASPDTMLQRVWQKAIERINELRDELGLMNRNENRDSNSTYVPRPIESFSSEPQDLISNTVPIPDIYGSERKEVPAEVTTEPDNPFAVR
ncbi:MAG: hypothetical protein RMJ43_14460 [Chloroherpetonaceae bacterium]|nr:hypothetical protein [Chthonomonadaceae bacterium]MDW8209034.1 hypothetical protein [Chloroherpetonaceae bacterium]